MTRKKVQPSTAPQHSRAISAKPPTVSVRWLLAAVGLTLLFALACAWAALCLLFWQGSWQLLYHPAAAVTRTPASVGIPIEQIGFAATESGELQLQGWWIPAATSEGAATSAALSRITVLYLHGQNGNLGDTVDALARLHEAGVNIFAFDYRGFGQSQFARPSEARWREDAGSALRYLSDTRHIAPRTIVLDGAGLGANLALEEAAEHPELDGVILDAPQQTPMQAVFSDSRAELVPAHLLVGDRFDLDAPAAALPIQSLWILSSSSRPDAYQKVTAPKTLIQQDSAKALAHWLTNLANR